MLRIKFLLIGTFILTSVFNASAAENPFKKNNPDGNKYEFARSYISALSYFQAIRTRWEKVPPKKKFAKDDIKVIHLSMDYLVNDNADLRVAKNYMIKYLDSPNSLMRKVSDLMIVACDRDIALNNKLKNLWQDWLIKKLQEKKVKPEDEKLFIEAQSDLELKRKESDKSIIKASILLTKVLLSQDNTNNKGKLLPITRNNAINC